jgi:hypothetical protein
LENAIAGWIGLETVMLSVLYCSKSFDFQIRRSSRILDLKRRIAAEVQAADMNISLGSLRLSMGKTALDDDQCTLDAYGIEDNTRIVAQC